MKSLPTKRRRINARNLSGSNREIVVLIVDVPVLRLEPEKQTRPGMFAEGLSAREIAEDVKLSVLRPGFGNGSHVIGSEQTRLCTYSFRRFNKTHLPMHHGVGRADIFQKDVDVSAVLWPVRMSFAVGVDVTVLVQGSSHVELEGCPVLIRSDLEMRSGGSSILQNQIATCGVRFSLFIYDRIELSTLSSPSVIRDESRDDSEECHDPLSDNFGFFPSVFGSDVPEFYQGGQDVHSGGSSRHFGGRPSRGKPERRKIALGSILRGGSKNAPRTRAISVRSGLQGFARDSGGIRCQGPREIATRYAGGAR